MHVLGFFWRDKWKWVKTSKCKHFHTTPHGCCCLKGSQSGSRYKISSSPCSLVLARLPTKQLPSGSLIGLFRSAQRGGHSNPGGLPWRGLWQKAEPLLWQTFPISPQGMCLVLLQPVVSSDLFLLRLCPVGCASSSPLAPRWLNSALVQANFVWFRTDWSEDISDWEDHLSWFKQTPCSCFFTPWPAGLGRESEG